ncbi:MAG: hypothetical protein CM15mP83_5870 [Flavobacteriaceae bacterium]|nr:MAG: hypothetical protein CM15mP83_5870 [Flavobacteriaceae bacterium]
MLKKKPLSRGLQSVEKNTGFKGGDGKFKVQR